MVLKVLIYGLSLISIILLFFSPFGPISVNYIPLYHPIGWAGIFTYLAMVLIFDQKYRATNDLFWLILIAGFFPLLISDLYFFPLPKFFGLGMHEWAGFQFIVFLVGFIYYSRNKLVKYSNLVTLLTFPLVALGIYTFKEDPILSSLGILSILILVVVACSLSYYAFQRRNYLFIVGIILNFMIANVIVSLYLATGWIAFGWSHLFMAVITDSLAIFGRVLMALSATRLWASDLAQKKPFR